MKLLHGDMKYTRIDLWQTNYELLPNCKLMGDEVNIVTLNAIYHAYCRYKKFESFMPIFDSQYTDLNSDVFGYYDNEKLVAFSLIKKYGSFNVEAIQFAWDYVKPELRLGINSLKNECAYYKKLGYRYLYLGLADKYKEQFDGFEILKGI